MRVSEIRVKRIRVNQGLGVVSMQILETLERSIRDGVIMVQYCQRCPYCFFDPAKEQVLELPGTDEICQSIRIIG